MLPISIKLTNFQSYDNAKLDFDFKSALIIGERDNNSEASNACGKSAIFRAIAWNLHNKSQHKSANGVVKRGADFTEVDFVFEHDDKRYRNVRKYNKRFSKGECALYEFDENGIETIVPCDTNTEVNKKIQELTKSNYDTFLNSSYFQQGSVSDFLDGTSATKQKILGSVLDLDKWNKRLKAAKKVLDEKKITQGKIEFSLSSSETVEKDLAEAEINLSDYKDDARVILLEERSLLDSITVLDKKITELKGEKSSLVDYHNSITQFETMTERLVQLRDAVAEKTTDVDSLSQKILRAEGSIVQLDAKVTEISAHVEINDHLDLGHLERQLAAKQARAGWLLARVDEWKPDALCVCCDMPWNSHGDKVEDYTRDSNELAELNSEISPLSDKIDYTKEAVRKVKKAELEIEKLTSRRKSLEGTNEINLLKKGVINSELVKLVEQLEDTEQRVNSLETSMNTLKGISNSDSFEEIRGVLDQKKSRLEEVITSKNENSYEVGGYTQKVATLQEQLAKKKVLEESLKVAAREVAVANVVCHSFSRSGIQAIIIDNVMEELTQEVNQWLHEFCYEPTYINFITQKQDGKGGWKEVLEVEIVNQSGTGGFESLSGGEAFRVAFAIRLGLAQIQARRMGGETQILLLDEVSTALDKHGLDLFVSIIRKIERHMKVIVITHDDKLKDEFSHVICAKRTGNNSTIEIR